MRLPDSLRVHLNGLRFVIVALSMSPLLFLVVGFVAGKNEPSTVTRVLAWAGAALGLVALGARGPLRRALTARGRRSIVNGTFRPHGAMSGPAWQQALASDGDTARLFSVYQSATIVPTAMMEAGALVAGVSFFLGGTYLALGIAVGLVVLLFGLNFPTEHAVTDWLVEQQKLLRADS